jgi:hypothetical protein
MAKMRSWFGHLRGAIPILLKDLGGKSGSAKNKDGREIRRLRLTPAG